MSDQDQPSTTPLDLDALRAEMTRLEHRHCSFAPPDHSRAWRELLLWVEGHSTPHNDEGTQ